MITQQQQPLITLRSSIRTNVDASAIYDVLAQLHTRLDWESERSGGKHFRLLTLDAPGGPASEGTVFSATGVVLMGTFHDRSTINEAIRGERFAFTTESAPHRKRAATWHATFNSYTLRRDAGETVIDYACDVIPQNYVPYWLKPVVRKMTARSLKRPMGKCLRNLAALAAASTAQEASSASAAAFDTPAGSAASSL